MTLQTIPQINNLEFAKKNQEIHGIIENYEFSRLTDLIVASTSNTSVDPDKAVVNKIAYHLTGKLLDDVGEGGISDPKQWGLVLALNGQLNLKCQRCLNAMPYNIDINAQFIVSPSMKVGSHDLELEGDSFNECSDDDIEVMPADEHMQVLDLIEDELLLTLPLAPMHTEKQHAAGMCVELSKINEVGKLNPFDVLKTLKK